jgi:hypothetical protein
MLGSVPVDELGEASIGPEMVAASGHPHAVWRLCESGVAPMYSGSAVLACVARQFRTVKGESMLISKWRRRWPVGSSGSAREILMTIYITNGQLGFTNCR